MTEPASVTTWLNQVQNNHPDQELAAQKLWERYLERLIRLAASKLGSAGRRDSDEQDVVQEAFEAFFRAARQGKLPPLKDRDNFWPLLVTITERKVLDAQKRQTRHKRGGGRVRGDSVFGHADGSGGGFQDLPGRELDPRMAAAAADSLRRLLGMLEPQLARIAILRMQGHTNLEIAAELNCVPETVIRKVRRIRQAWEGVLGDDFERND